jgi:hypothetical protein
MNPYDHTDHVVRIRRKLKLSRYRDKCVYRYYRYEITIPTKYEDLIQPFMDKDLHVKVKQEANSLFIEAKPIEKSEEAVGTR